MPSEGHLHNPHALTRSVSLYAFAPRALLLLRLPGLTRCSESAVFTIVL
jgi:hypothetical protein